MTEQDYLRVPFDKYDSASLETLPDEVFFARRFVLSEEDQEKVDRFSAKVGDSVFYKTRLVDPIFRKYAKMTNPKPGEPGTRQNPLIRFGRAYVYDCTGLLSELVVDDPETGYFTLAYEPKPNEEQKEMLRYLEGHPMTLDDDCPHLTPDQLERMSEYGRKRNERRRLMKSARGVIA